MPRPAATRSTSSARRTEVVRACVARATEALSVAPRSPATATATSGATRRPTSSPPIRAVEPDILFLGFGTPAKEYFMHRHYRALGVPFVMGVGGSFDVYAGLVARAPRWMQRAGSSGRSGSLRSPAGCGSATWSVTRGLHGSSRASCSRPGDQS